MRDDPESPANDRFPGYDGMEAAALRRYVAGRSDPAERRRVEAWAAEAVDRRRYLAAMRELHARGPADPDDAAATAAAWGEIAARMEPPVVSPADATRYVAPWEEPVVRVDVRRRPPRILMGAFVGGRPRRALLGAAAAVLLAIAGGTLLLRGGSPPAAPAPATRQIATTKGQRAEIQLGDGSRVILGVESRLRFPAEFGAGARELYLEGTASFDVVHDAHRPFLVRTPNAITEDLGTRFVISAYPESRATQVVVSEGAVALRPARASGAVSVVLTAGRLGHLMAGATTASVRSVDPALYDAWTRGQLVFRDTPLAEVIAELRRWYDLDVRLGDPSLRDVPLTASFAVESSQEAVAVVTTVAPVRAVWRGRAVTLYRR